MLAKDTVKVVKYAGKVRTLVVESEEAVQYDEGNNLRLALEAFASCMDGADVREPRLSEVLVDRVEHEGLLVLHKV